MGSDLRGFEDLPESRQKMIEAALNAADEVAGMPYKFGGNGAVISTGNAGFKTRKPMRCER